MGLLGQHLMTEGWERYRPDDLLADLRDHRNRNIPLATIQGISTSGRNDVWLELEVATLQGLRRLRGAHIDGTVSCTGSFSAVPVGSGESMVPVADAIRRVKRGVALEAERTACSRTTNELGEIDR